MSFSVNTSWSEQNEAAVLEPFKYTTSTPGKDIRTQLIEAFDLWLRVPPDKKAIIARIVNMLHSASLMQVSALETYLQNLISPRIDDIEDDAQLRRGQPVAHKIYGIPQTINSANYIYFLALKELAALRSEALDVATLVTGKCTFLLIFLFIIRGTTQSTSWSRHRNDMERLSSMSK